MLEFLLYACGCIFAAVLALFLLAFLVLLVIASIKLIKQGGGKDGK